MTAKLYKVGDRVKIRTDLKDDECYGLPFTMGLIKVYSIRGREFTIKGFNPEQNCYLFDMDEYLLTDEMISHKIVERKFKAGDKVMVDCVNSMHNKKVCVVHKYSHPDDLNKCEVQLIRDSQLTFVQEDNLTLVSDQEDKMYRIGDHVIINDPGTYNDQMSGKIIGYNKDTKEYGIKVSYLNKGKTSESVYFYTESKLLPYTYRTVEPTRRFSIGDRVKFNGKAMCLTTGLYYIITDVCSGMIQIRDNNLGHVWVSENEFTFIARPKITSAYDVSGPVGQEVISPSNNNTMSQTATKIQERIKSKFFTEKKLDSLTETIETIRAKVEEYKEKADRIDEVIRTLESIDSDLNHHIDYENVQGVKDVEARYNKFIESDFDTLEFQAIPKSE